MLATKASGHSLSVAPDAEGLVNGVPDKIDALLTLTDLSLQFDKPFCNLVFLPSQSQSFSNSSGRSLTGTIRAHSPGDSLTNRSAGKRSVHAIPQRQSSNGRSTQDLS